MASIQSKRIHSLTNSLCVHRVYVFMNKRSAIDRQFSSNVRKMRDNSLKMSLVKSLILVLCAVQVCYCVKIPTENEIAPVDLLRTRFFELETRLWKNLADTNLNEVTSASADIELAKAYSSFDQEFKKLEPHVKGVNHEFTSSWVWSKIASNMLSIDNIYDSFVKFVNRQAQPGTAPAPIQSWLDLAEIIMMDPEKSVNRSVHLIGQFTLHGNLYRTVLQETNNALCGVAVSENQMLYNIYNKITLTEIKGYAMMQFSWMLLKIYGKGNFTQEANLMRQRYEERSALTVQAIKSEMADASRDMYKCDPEVHEPGETYTQLTRFLQGYIENEVDMNPDGTCKENCAHYSLTQNYGCFKDMYCKRQPKCEGRILSCTYVDSDMTICPAERNSDRRYNWIEYENRRVLGRPGSCMRGTTKVDSWWRFPYHCSYCLCLCEESQNLSDRYFSLRTVVANIENNKVITGIRFVKKDRIIHLQISEGTLLPRATIDTSSVGGVTWQPVERMSVTDPNFADGIDYHTLTFENRAIDLDELEGPEGTVLTGVRFRMTGAHLHFEIRSTPFNYTTGRLDVANSVWVSNDNTEGADEPRSRLEIPKPDVPTRAPSPSVQDSRHDQYLEFTHSDLDADAAQTAVPFIDTQPLQPSTPVPLAGAGIIHKGKPGYGGFVAPKVFTYDFSKHMYAKAPEEEPLLEKDVEFSPSVF